MPLDSSDPVVMHLLAETALTDSANLQVLSFEEVEELKKELSLLSNRIDASKRKLALEMKLQEAAQSLGRLENSNGDYGHGADTQDSEVAISTQKCENLAQELWKLERRASELRSKLLEHTAGVLQMTHKGLKKKSSAKNASEVNGDSGIASGVDHFDNRSLYRSVDCLDDLGTSQGGGRPAAESVDMSAIQSTTTKLEQLNQRLREMILNARPDEDFDPIPQQAANSAPASSAAAVHDHLAYLERGLESMASCQSPAAPTAADPATEERLEEFNKQLDDVLVDIGARQKFSPHNSTIRKGVTQQLGALEEAIHDVQKRITGLSEQKTILTTQIQQQRELNSKSDAERDAQISELQEELDSARAGPDQNEVHEEKDAEISRLRSEYADLESEMVRIQTELTMVKAELDGAYGTRKERAAEAPDPNLMKEMEELSERNLSLTEELASLKAEQSSNKNNPDLQQRVQMLEKELRETIDDYEALTKSSIEFEKERDNLEGMIDKYRDRCEDLEAQLNDERIQGLGNKSAPSASGGREAPPAENTSTSTLKQEFKKMMRDTRTENMKALKVWSLAPPPRMLLGLCILTFSSAGGTRGTAQARGLGQDSQERAGRVKAEPKSEHRSVNVMNPVHACVPILFIILSTIYIRISIISTHLHCLFFPH